MCISFISAKILHCSYFLNGNYVFIIFSFMLLIKKLYSRSVWVVMLNIDRHQMQLCAKNQIVSSHHITGANHTIQPCRQHM